MYGRGPSFRDRLSRFMYGRRGYDELSRALWILSLVLLVVNAFCELLAVSIIECVIVIYALFRMLSKNITARAKENDAYLRITGKMRGFFKLRKNKRRDRKTHVYRKCPSCKNVLRLPREKGAHTVKCPCCSSRFDIKIR